MCCDTVASCRPVGNDRIKLNVYRGRRAGSYVVTCIACVVGAPIYGYLYGR